MTARLAIAAAVLGLLAALSPAAASPGSDVDAGRQVYEANCIMCHGADASGMMGMHPSLRGGIERLTREGVEVTIRNGRDTTPPMPAFAGTLSDREVDQVIAYIDSLPPGPRNFGPEEDDMMNGMDGMMGGMGGWMWLLLLLAAVVVIVAVVAIVRAAGGGRRTDADLSPRELLDRRYAQGDLPREEYLQRRDDLEH